MRNTEYAKELAIGSMGYAKIERLYVKEQQEESHHAIYQYTPKEVESQGKAIYGQQIRDKVESKHKGKFLVIDIETGEYEMNADDLVATKHLPAKHPNAVVYSLQIGFPTAYRISEHFSVKTQ